MIRNILFLSLAALGLFMSCNSNHENKKLTAIEKIKLSHVKSRIECIYYLTSKGYKKDKYSYKLIYDKDGRPVEQQSFTDSVLREKSFYHYDNKGNLTDSVEYILVRNRFDKEEFSAGLKEVMKYDDKGHKIAQQTIYPDGTPGKLFNFKYNKYGKLTESDYGGNITYQYNDKGLLIAEEAKDTDEGNTRTLFRYDNRERLIETTYSDPGDNKEAKTVYQYNDKGNLIKEISYSYAGVMDSKITYEYNENGSLLSTKSYNKEGLFITEEKYSYDGNSNLTEISYYYKSDRAKYIKEYTYEYYDK